MHFRPTDTKNKRALCACTTSESALGQGGNSFYLSPPHTVPHNRALLKLLHYIPTAQARDWRRPIHFCPYKERFLKLMPNKTTC